MTTCKIHSSEFGENKPYKYKMIKIISNDINATCTQAKLNKEKFADWFFIFLTTLVEQMIHHTGSCKSLPQMQNKLVLKSASSSSAPPH